MLSFAFSRFAWKSKRKRLITFASLAKLSSELRKRFGNVAPLFLTPEKAAHLRKENPVFYYSLVFGSMTLHGGGLEEI